MCYSDSRVHSNRDVDKHKISDAEVSTWLEATENFGPM